MEKIDVALMKNVAAQLGGWKVEVPEDAQDTWRCYLKKGDKEIYVNATWAGSGKYYMNGSYPRNQRNELVTPYVQVKKTRDDGSQYDSWQEMKKPEISFSPAKGPGKIVADIKRRFLPEYEAYFEAVQKKIEETNYYYSSMDSALEKVCKAVGVKAGVQKDQVYVGSFGCGSLGQVRVQDSGAEVKMDLECPMEIALKIFKLLEEGEDKC